MSNTWYQQPPPTPPTTRPGNGLAVAGFVIGVVSIVFFWAGLFEFVLLVLAIVFSGVGISRADKGASGKGLAVAGIIFGILACLAYVLFGIATLGFGFIL